MPSHYDAIAQNKKKKKKKKEDDDEDLGVSIGVPMARRAKIQRSKFADV